MVYFVLFAIFMLIVGYLSEINRAGWKNFIGDSDHREKGDVIYIDERGYKRFANSNRLVHRWIAGKTIGRKLSSEEVVHHKNGNKRDNRRINLLVCKNQAEHEAIHQRYF